MKKHAGIILILVILVYLFINMASVVTYPNEYKVIKTMGKISRVTTEPGFSFRIPVVQSETTISKARQLYDIAPTEIYFRQEEDGSRRLHHLEGHRSH